MAFKDKSVTIQAAMKALAPHGENLGNDKDPKCAWCGEPATDFTDELSQKEFGISGMCQGCQDNVWDS